MNCLGENQFLNYEHPMYKPLICNVCNWQSLYCLDCHLLHQKDIDHGVLSIIPDTNNKKILHIHYICKHCIK